MYIPGFVAVVYNFYAGNPDIDRLILRPELGSLGRIFNFIKVRCPVEHDEGKKTDNLRPEPRCFVAAKARRVKAYV